MRGWMLEPDCSFLHTEDEHGCTTVLPSTPNVIELDSPREILDSLPESGAKQFGTAGFFVDLRPSESPNDFRKN